MIIKGLVGKNGAILGTPDSPWEKIYAKEIEVEDQNFGGGGGISSISQKEGNAIVAEEDGIYCDAIVKEDLTEMDFSVFPTHEEVRDFNELTKEKYAEQVKHIEDYCNEYQANLDAEEYVKKQELTELDISDTFIRLNKDIDDFNTRFNKDIDDFNAQAKTKYDEQINNIETYCQDYKDNLDAEEYVKKRDLRVLDIQDTIANTFTHLNEDIDNFNAQAKAKYDEQINHIETYCQDYQATLDAEEYVKRRDLRVLDIQDTIANTFSHLNEDIDNFKEQAQTKYDEQINHIETYCQNYQDTLDAEEYVKKRDLTVFNIESLITRLEALEKAVFKQETEEGAANE